jgi:DNA repair protein RadA/Sms
MFICRVPECRKEFDKWFAICPHCGGVDTMRTKIVYDKKGNTGMRFFDDVIGGKLRRGQVILLGAAAGLGKSTLMLQVVNSFVSSTGALACYCTVEENAAAVSERADRLGLSHNFSIVYAADHSLRMIMAHLSGNRPRLFVVDSLHLLADGDLQPGSAAMVARAAEKLTDICKALNLTGILISHLNKEGDFAGSTRAEHLVDTVLKMEKAGDSDGSYIKIYASKNRFGQSHIYGYMKMTDKGLMPWQIQ